ncbi:MAG: hypothetical protein R3Y05_00430 [bacterium]
MTKKENKTSIYDTLLKYRKLIMLSAFLIVAPIFLIVAFYTTSYKTNKPDPFASVSYVSSTIEEINNTKFKIEEYYIETFYGQTAIDEDGNQSYLGDGDGGKIVFKLDTGAAVDTNIVGDSLRVEVYATYNWVNYTSGKGSSNSINIPSNLSTITISNFVTDWNKKPFWFVKVDLEDVNFITSFSWTEEINGESKTVTYVIESDYDDLINENTKFNN